MSWASTLLVDVFSTVFNILDHCFGWIFILVDGCLNGYVDDVDVNQGPLDMILEYIGVSDQLNVKPKPGALQKIVCRHYKKVLTTLVALLGSLIYMKFSSESEYKPNLVESLYCGNVDEECNFLPDNCDCSDSQNEFLRQDSEDGL